MSQRAPFGPVAQVSQLWTGSSFFGVWTLSILCSPASTQSFGKHLTEHLLCA